jgi:3-hydroxy-9,10-secoandrosta-1,3,5(10)-triene-9,17-dione monooxygenase reductase component
MNWFGRNGRGKSARAAAGAGPALDARHLRRAFGSFATGVAIVTTTDPIRGDAGVTVNSLSSLSLDPPLLLWSIARSSSSYAVFRDARYFAVHVLDYSQLELSRQFATKGIDRFAGVALKRGAGRCPLLDQYHARFECSLASHYEGGDHLIVVGHILGIDHKPGQPLLFYGGSFTSLPGDGTAAAAG